MKNIKIKFRVFKTEFFLLLPVYLVVWLALYYRLYTRAKGIGEDGVIILGIMALIAIAFGLYPWIKLFRQIRIAENGLITEARDLKVERLSSRGGWYYGVRVTYQIEYHYQVEGQTYNRKMKIPSETAMRFYAQTGKWHVIYSKNDPQKSLLYELSYLLISNEYLALDQ